MPRSLAGTASKSPSANGPPSPKRWGRTQSPQAPAAGGPRAMLRELSVQNLALIEDIRVELEGGYCVWTGETGAGKSLLLTALGLVLGGKASAELIRSGKTEARAAAVFEIVDSDLRAEIETILGGALDDDQLIVTRRLAAEGRGGAQANGLPVPISTLQKLGERLVDIHGQLEGRALLEPSEQRSLLDAYGGLGDQLGAYEQARQAHESLRRRREALVDSAETRRRERALLEFERDELEAAEPQPGEYQELAREAIRLQHADQIRSAAARGYSLLYEADRSAQDLITHVARGLEPLARTAAEIAEAVSTLERLAGETREVAFTLRHVEQCCDDDPDRIEEVEARMAVYRRLAARFRCAPDELADRRAAIEAKLGDLEDDDSALREIDAPLAAAWAELKIAASCLTAGRRKVAADFGRIIQKRLKPLGLEAAALSVTVETRALDEDPRAAGPPAAGPDRVEMLFSANPGEDPRPLRKIASGGELARVTLAIKTVLAAVDRVPTLVFDEIDAGVGGRLGSALGKSLAELARRHQVICVTHLPQLASHADRHWVIRKQVARGRSRTLITPLSDSERVDELAAMLRGDSAAEGTRHEARAMLREAQDSH
jgi:DNA repair protein RecN (Recombination protein N)